MSRRVYLTSFLLIAAVLAGALPQLASAAPARLRFSPNPVKLKQRFTVTLTGATPGESLTFLATPDREGFGGGNMGVHRANAAGIIRFRYGPFKNKLDIGHWTVTVVRVGKGMVTKAALKVVLPKKPKPAKTKHKK